MAVFFLFFDRTTTASARCSAAERPAGGSATTVRAATTKRHAGVPTPRTRLCRAGQGVCGACSSATTVRAATGLSRAERATTAGGCANWQGACGACGRGRAPAGEAPRFSTAMHRARGRPHTGRTAGTPGGVGQRPARACAGRECAGRAAAAERRPGLSRAPH